MWQIDHHLAIFRFDVLLQKDLKLVLFLQRWETFFKKLTIVLEINFGFLN
jgi:hypothetical protein